MDSDFPYRSNSFDTDSVWEYCLMKSEDFSANDSISDYGAELSKALLRLHEEGGGSVKLREGVYPVSSSIVMQNNTCICGESLEGVILRVTDNSTSKSETRGVIHGTWLSKVVVRDLTVDGNMRNQTDVKSDSHLSKYGAYFEASKHVWINKVRVRSAIAYGSMLPPSRVSIFPVLTLLCSVDTPGNDEMMSHHVAIEGVVVDSCGKDGIKLYRVKHASVHRSTTLNNGRHGIQIAGSRKVFLMGSYSISDGSMPHMDGCGAMIRDREGMYTDGVLVKYQRVHNSYRAGLCVWKSKNVQVTDAIITNMRRINATCYDIDQENTRNFTSIGGFCDADMPIKNAMCPGIAKSGVCCPAKCGKCGGIGCSQWGPHGTCCVTKIREFGDKCADSPPPCIL